MSKSAAPLTAALAAQPLVLVLLYYLLAVLVVGPWGDFPLNDDWVYAGGARLLLESGRLDMPTSCSPCLLHIALGALAAKLFGFSYTTLRCLTLAIGFAGALALYLLARELQAGRRLSALVTMVYVANPLVLSLSFSFMTDVAAMTLSSFYLLCFCRYLRRSSLPYLLMSALALVSAIAVRQGTVVFVVANAAVLIYLAARRRYSWTFLFALVVAPIACAYAADLWLAASDKISDSYVWFKSIHRQAVVDFLRAPGKGLFAMAVACGQVGCYLGLYCAPLLVPCLPLLAEALKIRPRIAPCAFILPAVTMTASLTKVVGGDGRLMPFNQNMLRLPQVGPPNLMGISIPLLKSGPRRWLTWLSALLAFMLYAMLLSGCQRALSLAARSLARPAGGSGGRPLARAAVLLLVFLSMLLTLAGVAFETVVLDVDRHYLLALVPVLLCLAVTARWLRLPVSGWLAIPLVVALGAYSLCAAQDYLSWNRARWQAARDIEAQGIAPAAIDGGAEYNFSHDVGLWVKTFKGADPGRAPHARWRWWRVNDDEYIISFSPIPNYDVVARHRYFSALSLREQEVLTLRRLPSLSARRGQAQEQ